MFFRRLFSGTPAFLVRASNLKISLPKMTAFLLSSPQGMQELIYCWISNGHSNLLITFFLWLLFSGFFTVFSQMNSILLVIYSFSKLCFKIIFRIFLILNLFSEMIATFPELSLHKSDELSLFPCLHC